MFLENTRINRRRMRLVEQYIIKKSDYRFKELDKVCMLSKNLYNVGLYEVRQYYFNTGKYLNYFELVKKLQNENNVDYRNLPAKVSQQTLKLVDQNFKSFFSLLKKRVSKGVVRIPKYLNKEGRFIVTYTNQAISSKRLKEGFIKPSGLNLEIQTTKSNINQIRVIHKGNHIVVEAVFEVKDIELKKDNGRFCSIDLGLNNIATVGSNVIKPMIINGRPLKSINQYYNKQVAKLKSKLNGNKRTSNRIKRLTNKRNNKIKDYLHKSSRVIVNHLVSNNINTLVIGNNKGWKQDINIGKVNNQKFVMIPHSVFIAMLIYKCKLKGINVITTEESYTSKCSFLDQEEIKKHSKYLGRRVKRGLFKSSNGFLINADLNGALNILRKVVGNFDYDPIEVCSTPLVLTIKFN